MPPHRALVTANAVLAAYAVAVAALAPKVLGRAGWARRSPRLGVLAWQAALAGVLGAVALLAVGALRPTGAVRVDLGHLLHACAEKLALPGRLTPAGAVSVAALLVAVAAAVRLTWVLVTRTLTIRRQRRHQRELLDLLVRDVDDDGASILDTDTPLAYCVPGGRGRIVLTSGAARLLTDEQRAAVVAHERAHLQGRHDLVLLLAEVTSAAFGFVRVFAAARQELKELVEMLADDAAARTAGGPTVAAALVGLGVHQPPAATVGATGCAVADRVDRLLGDEPGVRRTRGSVVVVTAGAVLAGPWLIAAGPVLAAARGLCLGG